jgi:hypothetical protein
MGKWRPGPSRGSPPSDRDRFQDRTAVTAIMVASETAQPLVFRWGIISTGTIASVFVKVGHLIVFVTKKIHPHRRCHWQEILIDPKTFVSLTLLTRWSRAESSNTSRETYDVIHKVTAVASRSLAKAQIFIDTIAHGDKSIKAYGSYEDIYVDEVGQPIPYWKSTSIEQNSFFSER